MKDHKDKERYQTNLCVIQFSFLYNIIKKQVMDSFNFHKPENINFFLKKWLVTRMLKINVKLK